MMPKIILLIICYFGITSGVCGEGLPLNSNATIQEIGNALAGSWTATDDPDVLVIFDDGYKKEYYAGNLEYRNRYKIETNCESRSLSDGIYIVTNDPELGEECWEIGAITEIELVLYYVSGRGNTLAYTRTGQ